VTQETDQSYRPFQSAVRTNLHLIIDERIAADKPTSLSPWIVGLIVFGGEDPETGLIVGSPFQRGFSHEQNVKAWEKVGAVPLSRRCLSSPKVRRSIGDGTDNQQALVYLLVEHNTIACNALTLEGHQKQHHVPYSLAILINGICLLIHGIASTLWAFQYVFSST
jgi:hypothetical protein